MIHLNFLFKMASLNDWTLQRIISAMEWKQFLGWKAMHMCPIGIGVQKNNNAIAIQDKTTTSIFENIQGHILSLCIEY
jgi:hypothetical protein